MNAQRDPCEMLRARQRQQCQAHGLRALAELVESDERASGLLDTALVDLGRHLGGADRSGDLEHLCLVAEQAGAVLVEERKNSKFHVVKLQWSNYFGIAMQCEAPPADDDEPAGPEPAEVAT